MAEPSTDQAKTASAQRIEPRRSADAILLLSLLAFTLPVLYVLSIGPAYRFFPGPWLPKVYRPLTQLESHCKPLDRFMTWYMEKVWQCGVW
jgi:hypothetical protein